MSRRWLILVVVLLITGTGVITYRVLTPRPKVQDVQAWLDQLPKNGTTSDVTRLFEVKGIKFENQYPPGADPNTPHGFIHGTVAGGEHLNSFIDVTVYVDETGHIVSAHAREFRDGP